MKKMLIWLTVLFMLATVGYAQTAKVTGKVIDTRSGGPVESASIVLKGKGSGTTTLADGSFTINAGIGEVLVVSSIGFTSKEVTVTDAQMTISMESANETLTDVVVVGYGQQRKSTVTGSMVTLKNDALIKRQVSSASQALQGLAPGVTVQQQSGRPGADGAGIRIRGESSILGNSNPLVVIDGLQMPNNTGLDALNQIDVNAIESITVLKDAASTAIYGNRGSAGVIIVKTKRAVKEGIKVSYNNFFSLQDFTSIPQRVNAIDHMELSNLAEQNRTGNPASRVFPDSTINKYKTRPADNLEIIDTDWLNEVLTNSGFMQNHNVQLMSGGEHMNVFSSFTYFDQQGLTQNTSQRRYDIRLNPEFKLGKKLSLIGNFAYNNSTTTTPSTGSAEFVIRQAIGLPAIGGGKFGPEMYGNAAQSNNRNPIAMAEATGNSVTENNTLLARFGFSYRPIEGLELEGYWGREKRNPHVKSFVKNANVFVPNVPLQRYDLVSQWPGTTTLSESWRDDSYTTLLGQATYQFKIKENHRFKVLAGAQNEVTEQYFFGASRTGFINPDQPFLNLGSGARDNNAGSQELALVGFYGRLNYSYNDKYLLEVNGRYDGSSRFSQANDKQWGSFGSASAGWIFSKEKFFDGLSDAVSFGKLRFSIGSNGNQNIGSNFYVFDAFYNQSVYNNNINGTNAYTNNITNVGLAILQFSNPFLEWERSKQWNVGLDVSFLKNFTLTADYYVRTLEDMILERTLPQSAGGLANPFVNAGSMENKGWEFSLNYRKKFGKLNVDVTGMLSDVQNNVNSLIEGLPFLGDGFRTAAGQPLGSYFGYRANGYFSDSNDVKSSPVQFGIPWNGNPSQGPKPGDVKYADIGGIDGKPDGKIDVNDRTFLGNAFPRYEYSINLNLAYAGFDVNIFGQGVGKRDNFLSGTGAVPFASNDFAASLLEQHKDHWTPTNQNALFPRLLPSGFGGNNYLLSNKWIRSAAYFRLKNINLGYTIPAPMVAKAKIESVRVFVSAQNLFTATSAWDGFDPEINNANAEFYPLMRTWTAGINVKF